MIFEIFLLLILFQLKHYIVDFVIQINDPNSMKKFDVRGWIGPLAKHAGDHSTVTFVIAIFFTNIYLAMALALLDFVLHFSMDRVKASPHILGRFKYPEPRYWYSLGGDQAFHHFTHYLIIFIIVYWG